LESLQIEAAKQSLSGSGFSDFIKGGTKSIEPEVRWPWYSLLFYYGMYCSYWFFLGKTSYTIFKIKLVKIPVAIAVLTSLLFMDRMFLLYLIFIYLGHKLSSVKPRDTILD